MTPGLGMPAEPEMPRELQILGEFAEMELALAREAFRRAQAAESVQDFETCSKAFKGLARSGRMSLALRDRFIRTSKQDARDFPPPEPPKDHVRIARRRQELGDAVAKVIWNETEGFERETLYDTLIDTMQTYKVRHDFGLQPLDRHVLEHCAMLGLPLDAAENWRDLPPAPDDHFGIVHGPNRDDDDDGDTEHGEGPDIDWDEMARIDAEADADAEAALTRRSSA